ncbi:STAS domain-containing protein [Dactylosporangium aurantiacum]|uniref:STAS domain-containing protein n=1 Tax=Dactylosporangium aurantiacum TaxID=35754 RepID=A0A9Q9ISG4_9ACTN|nr:STAS domain-containing protein [Dactylosporangium aurantiacum]MDG6108275.1 STAS domain-containing protein [Dactylosporangium aurantiacum]UWZ58534.1 STAS domain-containing protein [Dactylosporangium aurantiacum]
MTVLRKGGVAHVAAAGDVDLCTAPALRDALRRAATATNGPVEVDLRQVTFFSCAGAATSPDGALVRVRAGRSGCRRGASEGAGVAAVQPGQGRWSGLVERKFGL